MANETEPAEEIVELPDVLIRVRVTEAKRCFYTDGLVSHRTIFIDGELEWVRERGQESDNEGKSGSIILNEYKHDGPRRLGNAALDGGKFHINLYLPPDLFEPFWIAVLSDFAKPTIQMDLAGIKTAAFKVLNVMLWQTPLN
jgi:hypothetical protein